MILILKIRVADCLDQDFIEIDIEDNQLNYQSLKVLWFLNYSELSLIVTSTQC